MPYTEVSELPKDVRDSLPKGAQSIWMSTFNSAVKNNDETTAIKMAWGAVKEEYKQNEDGDWIKKARNFFEKNEELRYTLGVVYSPYEIDSQDDFTDEEVIRKAAWDYLRKVQKVATMGKRAIEKINTIVDAIENEKDARIEISDIEKTDIEKSLGVMHTIISDELGDIVESYIAPTDMVIKGEPVKKGSWLLGVQWTEPIYNKIKSGELTGYSMGGSGDKMEVNIDAE